MRRFRFIGDPSEYSRWEKRPIQGVIYDEEKHAEYYGSGSKSAWKIIDQHEDWQEVFDEPKPLHKDTDLGHFAGLAMQGILANSSDIIVNLKDSDKSYFAVLMAKELIKQLDSLHDSTSNHNE